MTLPLRHRRRAERFAQLLDEADGGRRQHLRTPVDEELTELLALRHQLVSAGAGPDVDPEFRIGLRAMLVATAEREGIGRTAPPEPALPAPRRTVTSPAGRPVRGASARAATRTAARAAARTVRTARGPRARTAVVAGVAVGAVAFTGMSTASENAVPGDALYGVKRSTERAQLALASSDVGRGQLYLGFAQTRLAEAQTLAGDLERVLDDMDRETSQGVRLLTGAAAQRQDRAALDAVDEFTAGQRRSLADLAGQVTGADQARLAASLELLDAVERRTSQLRQSLQECAGPSATSIDSLGPVPEMCVTLPVPRPLEPDRGQATQPAPPEAHPTTRNPIRPDGPAAVEPDDPANDPDRSEPSTTSKPDGQSDSTDPEQPDSDADSEPDDDDGLLDGLNRLLGNLLGG
jgi:hypothetical protein